MVPRVPSIRSSSGLKPFTAHRLAVDTHLPDSLVGILLDELTRVQLLVEAHNEPGDEPYYLPAIDIHRITVGMVIRRIRLFTATIEPCSYAT